jgi:hypothetical protein
MRRSTAQPVELGIGVGVEMGEHFSLELHGAALHYHRSSWMGEDETVTVTPDPAAWRAFRRALEGLPEWPWQGRYDAAGGDGVAWAINIAYADGVVARCSGHAAYPGGGEAAFRRFCRAVSRLAGGREFGGEGAKGSQLRIREWVGERPADLERAVREELPTLPAGPIEWLSPLAAGGYKELRDDVWALVGVDPSPQAAGWWPKGGPVWDAVGRMPGGGIVLVEAKSHATELRSPRSKASQRSAATIEAALQKTKRALGVPQSAARDGTYYQVANRLAFLHWLHEHAHREAWLVNVYFTGDSFTSGGATVTGPADEGGWADPIAQAKQALQIPDEHRLSGHTADVFLPAAPVL